MSCRRSALALILSLALVWAGCGIVFAVQPREDRSLSERRQLADVPEWGVAQLFSGRYAADWETYLLDHFPARDRFRALKAWSAGRLLRLRDVNGLYVHDGYIQKMNGPLEPSGVVAAAARWNEAMSLHFPGTTPRYAVIPDRHSLVAGQLGRPDLDTEALNAQLAQHLGDAFTEIPLDGVLQLDAYYRTDPHWRQERLLPVADALLAGLGAPGRASERSWTEVTRGSFTGALAGQLALPVPPEPLRCLTGEVLRQAVAEDLADGTVFPVYGQDPTEETDPYDLFLGGVRPLVRLSRPGPGGTLVLFRDSFGSSIAPLLLSSYREILLVDPRLVSSASLDRVVTLPEDADVLFLFSAELIHRGLVFR